MKPWVRLHAPAYSRVGARETLSRRYYKSQRYAITDSLISPSRPSNLRSTIRRKKLLAPLRVGESGAAQNAIELWAYALSVHGRYSRYVMTDPVLLAGIRKYRLKRVCAGAREAVEVLLAGRCDFGRRVPDATELRAHVPNFGAVRKLTDVSAKMIIYQALIERELEPYP